MNADEFQSMVEAAYAALPERFAQAIKNVMSITAAFPNDATLRRMQVDSSSDLRGLYQGWPLSARGSVYAGQAGYDLFVSSVYPRLLSAAWRGSGALHSPRAHP